MALLLGLMRHVPGAHGHVLSGGWNRSAFVGRQLAGRSLGIVGFGRVGRAVARRALAFDMRVLAYDPLIGASAAMDGRVQLVDGFGRLLDEADCLSFHAKLTDETRQMLGAKEIERLKPSAVVVNCARGELIDEGALADALNEGRLAGAAIDVYSTEPPVGNPLLGAKNVVLTPHLGASTQEAQLAVATEAADALIEYLAHGEMRGAVNVVGMPGELSRRDRAYLDLCDRMGSILSAWGAAGIDRLRVTVRGDRLRELGATLLRQAMCAVLGRHVDSRLNLVNAEAVARERGIGLE